MKQALLDVIVVLVLVAFAGIARVQLFRDPCHKHAMRFCTVCVTDVELPEMF